MTREEEIREAAQHYPTEELYDRFEVDFEDIVFAFEEGAKWADTHPAKPESKQTVTIDAWVARDKCGIIQLYSNKPYREHCEFNGYIFKTLEDSDLPSVTWENSPKKVKVTVELCD